jgi:hypothetical protein
MTGISSDRRRACFAAAVIGLTLFVWSAGASFGKTLHVSAAVGSTVRVSGHVRLAKNCGPGVPPEMTISAAPTHGSLTTKEEVVTLTAADYGNCAPGHSGPGLVVYYTANSPGQDRFSYQMSGSGQPVTNWTVTVDVR